MSDKVRVKFRGNPEGFKIYRGDGLLLHAKPLPKSRQVNEANISVEKALQLTRDFPDAFEIVGGKKLLNEYQNKMVTQSENKAV